MRSFIRSTLAVIVGFVVASIVMMIVETLNGKVFYPELGKSAEGVMDREVVRRLLASAPVGALVVVLFGWALGSVAGGFTAALISGKPKGVNAFVLGALLTLAGIANNLMLPPPLWFWFPTLVIFLPATLIGSGLVRKRTPPETSNSKP